jgi:hypothetical protein
LHIAPPACCPVTRQYRPLFPPVSSGRDAIAGQSLESAVASDNQGNMCCPQSRKNFNTEEAARTTENHGARIQSAARKAQFAFYSVVLRRPPCFLRVENLADVPPPRSPRRKTKGQPVRSHADAVQAIVLGPPLAGSVIAMRVFGIRRRTERKRT